MKRALLLVALVVCMACSDDRKAAPAAPPCVGAGCSPGGGVIGGGGGTGDATVAETATDTAFDVPEAGVPVVAIVRALTRFTDDPAMGTPLTMSIVLRAGRMGGGSTDSTVGPDGTFLLNNVAVIPGVPSNIAIVQSGQLRANDGVWPLVGGTLNLPLFSEALPAAMWPTLVPASTLPPNTAHLVVHVVSNAGARLSGVSATTSSADAKGPFYDDGSDVVSGRTATGARGTILFMGSSATEISVTFAFAAKTLGFRVPLTPNVVTHFTATMN